MAYGMAQTQIKDIKITGQLENAVTELGQHQ